MFLSETINSNTISIFATTTTFILAINKCVLALHAVHLHVLLVIIDPVHTTAQELAVPYYPFNFANNSNMGDTTRRYSVIIDNNSNKDSVTYTETNYDDSRRTTNYTETNYNSHRTTEYKETEGNTIILCIFSIHLVSLSSLTIVQQPYSVKAISTLVLLLGS
ncbi:hypothetical protein U3516DRAFT_747786 [Neocallimastix sp. 'constans']